MYNSSTSSDKYRRTGAVNRYLPHLLDNFEQQQNQILVNYNDYYHLIQLKYNSILLVSAII